MMWMEYYEMIKKQTNATSKVVTHFSWNPELIYNFFCCATKQVEQLQGNVLKSTI